MRFKGALKGVEFSGWTFSSSDSGNDARENIRRHRSTDGSGDRPANGVGIHNIYVHGRDARDFQPH